MEASFVASHWNHIASVYNSHIMTLRYGIFMTPSTGAVVTAPVLADVTIGWSRSDQIGIRIKAHGESNLALSHHVPFPV